MYFLRSCWGDGECVSYRMRVRETSMSPFVDDDPVGVLCSVFRACDVLLVCYGRNHDFLSILSISQLPQLQPVRIV